MLLERMDQLFVPYISSGIYCLSFLFLVFSLYLMYFLGFIILCLGIVTSLLFSRYNDLRLRIFSKYPDLFPDEVIILH